MGVKNLAQIVEALTAHGKSPATPAALIRQGTTPQQEIIAGTLGTIVELAQAHKFSPPAILVVGKVVDLRNTLQWFDSKPLFGKGIVITRPERQADDLANLLISEGAYPIHFPTIKIVPPKDWHKLDAAMEALTSYDWLIFTSANGVQFFFERLREKNKDIRDLKGIKICCIGPATARQIEDRGIKVDLVPEQFIAEGILQSFAAMDLKGRKILLPRAAKARDVLPEGLKKMGAIVDVVSAYQTVNSGKKKDELAALISGNKVDVITFTSSSTVTNFVEIMGRDFILPAHIDVACIGPVTEAAAKKAGFKIDIQQEEYTMEGLVHSLINHVKKKSYRTGEGKI
jgi:uroporphyrinogen III methyltransferase/synthase